MSRTGDVYQGHARHQFLVALQLLPDFVGVLHVVNVEHRQSVQVASHQLPPWPFLGLAVLRLHRSLVIPIAGEGESRQRFLQVVGPCQQLLLIRFLLPFLLSRLGLQSSQRPESEFLIVGMPKPFRHGLLVLVFNGLQYFPSGVDVKVRRRFSDIPPEVLFAAFHGKKALCVFLICKHYKVCKSVM